jgi:PKD repeat protein
MAMQTRKIKGIIASLMGTMIILFSSCGDEGFDVPLPSTQADFDYEVEVFIDENTGQESFGVQLTNKSIEAASYSWDFGNGETSTEENPYILFTESGQYTITLEVTSPHELYYNTLTKSVTLTLGKQVVFAEDFLDGVPDNDEFWLPEGWQAIDNDGDGFNWYFGVRNGLGQMRSQSYDSGSDAPLNPDNWLILPEVDLTTTSDGALVTFRYTVGVSASTPGYRKEHYGIFISAGNDELENFTLLFEETFTEETPQWAALERTVDISAYAGETIYLAIRHYGVTDMDRMFVDEVEVYKIE